jgi:hypothetical protein
MIIKPEIYVTPDRPIVRIRESRENVDLAVELPKVLATQGWGLGTSFDVQFITHDRTELLACAGFLVVGESEDIRTIDVSANQTITKAVITRKFAQITPWWVSPDAKPQVAPSMLPCLAPPTFRG